MGLGTQVFLVLLGCCMRFIPARFVNMPHKEYWARPENFFTACRLLMHDFLWLGNLLAMWMILLNYSMAQANRVMPPQLDTSAFLFAMATFAVMLILWFITLWRRFRMPAAESRKRR
ncbi:MAG: hypothetical protein JWO94_3040 [Verrucomicrobiaceae bacterium]|nr:hypothetical protein [Verrucomicrobiaceae bacterium]